MSLRSSTELIERTSDASGNSRTTSTSPLSGSSHSSSDSEPYFRAVEVVYQERKYNAFTLAPRRSRKLRVEKNEDDIKFVVCQGSDPTESLEIASLKCKLENDIFSLYVDKLLPPHEDARLCSDALQRLGSCFALDLFEPPWDEIYAEDVAVPVASCDLGDGQSIQVRSRKNLIGSHYRGTVISSLQPDHDVTMRHLEERNRLCWSSKAVWDRYQMKTDPFHKFLRKVEVITACHLYGGAWNPATRSKKVASITGRPERVDLPAHIEWFFPTVPSLFGLFVKKFYKFKSRIGVPSYATCVAATSTTSELLEEDEEFGPDLEDGIAHPREGDDIADAPQLQESQVIPNTGISLVCHESERPKDSEQGDKTSGSMASTQQLLVSEKSRNLRDASDDNSNIFHSPPFLASEESESHAGAQDVMGSNDVLSGNHDGDVSTTAATSHITTASRCTSTDNPAHVAKDLLSFLLFTLAVILAILTAALDPAGEENWFKRIQEGVFVLFTVLVPTIFAVRSRLTDNLDWLMPARYRDVRTLKDLRNQKIEMDDEEFLRHLCTAILIDEEISELFSFKNASYKKTRKCGRLVAPKTTDYSGTFKEVWTFGGELCFNRMTGEVFKYIQREVDGRRMLMIQRNPENVEGVVVHLRKRDREFQIGGDLGV